MTPNGRKAARPFTARSLVGMSMGSRKRAVIKEMRREDHPEHGQRLDYWEVRAQYRIGERLRPCLGCSWCGTDPGDLPDDKWTECDGSGVLPARRSK